MTVSKNDLTALKTVKAFNDLARRAAVKGSETLSLIWKAGEIAKSAKQTLPHGRWMPFVEAHYDVTHRAVTRWIQFHDSVPESKLDTVSNLTAGIKMLDAPKTRSGEDDRTDAQGTKPKEPAPGTPRNGTDNPGGPSAWVDEAAEEEPEEDPTVQEIVDEHNRVIESFCRNLRKVANEKPNLEWLDHKGRWEGYFRKICQGLDTLRSAKVVVCPKCDGDTCKACDGFGYLPKVEAQSIQ